LKHSTEQNVDNGLVLKPRISRKRFRLKNLII